MWSSSIYADCELHHHIDIVTPSDFSRKLICHFLPDLEMAGATR